MNFYWVCTEGIIWTLNTTWGTNYIHHRVRLDKGENPTYQITILAEDGEEIDSFVAWTSLQELAKAIERRQNMKTAYNTRIENLRDGIKFSREDGSEVILTWEYDETNGMYYNGPVVETNGPSPEAIIREIAPLFNPKNNARDLSAEEIHSFLGTRVMHRTIK